MIRPPTTRQQVFLRALTKTGFDLDELQRVADKAMTARDATTTTECPYPDCDSTNTRRLTAEERECWDCQEDVVIKPSPEYEAS